MKTEKNRELELEEIEEKLTKNRQYDWGEIEQIMPKLKEIMRLRDEKNAVILAHHYQIPPIQMIADVRGDSLKLAESA